MQDSKKKDLGRERATRLSKMNRYRGYQWKVLRKGDGTRWTEINEVWNRGHHKLRTTSRFCVQRCHNPIHSPILAVCHFLLLPLPLCITVSFSHVLCLFISMAFFIFYLSRWLAHTTPIPPPDRSCNKFMNTSNEYSLSESSVLVGHCLHYFHVDASNTNSLHVRWVA